MKTAKKNKKNISWMGVVFLFVLVTSFIFRIVSLRNNLSFWNDESHTALMSRGIMEYGKPVTSYGSSMGVYQLALYYLTALFFKLFSISEFTGRLPSALAGAMLVTAGFVIGKKILNSKRALIVSFLIGFSQIQLAWSTQLRPYIWLELFTLLISYFLYQYIKSPWKLFNKNLAISVILSLTSCLFHGTGLLNLALVCLVIVYKIIKHQKFIYLLTIPIFGVVGALIVFSSMAGGWAFVRDIIFKVYLSPLHYRIFLTHNYLWLIVGAIIGFLTLFRRNRELSILLGGSIVFIFAVAIFKINPNYVRYSLPAFPLMYILFAEGVVSVVEKITKKEYLRWLLIALTLALLSLTGKFVFWPKNYYSINADVRENPIVDYKLAFNKIKDLIGDNQDIIVMDAWNDRVPWYLPGQNYIYLVKDGAGKTDSVFGEEMIGTIPEFEVERESFPSGIVIVEDWQSQTPEDMKDHIRKNLKFEFMVQDLPYNEDDHWGISVYSWGI